MRKRYIYLTLILSLLGGGKVYATCQDDLIQEYESIKDQFSVTYEYVEENNSYTLTFIKPDNSNFGYFFGVNSDLISGTMDCDYDASGCEKTGSCPTAGESTKVVCKNYKAGTPSIYIVASTDNCESISKAVEIELPYHNQYANSEACKGNEDFILCDENYDKEITEEEFNERLTSYENEKAEEEKGNNESKENKISKIQETFNNIENFVKNNLIIVIASLILVVIVVVFLVILVRNIIKRRRLE